MLSMAEPRNIAPDPGVIGGIDTPPFARLPDPEALFLKRGLRLRAYAERSDLKPFLLFLADLAQAQAAIQPTLPAPALSDGDTLARVRGAAMPPIDRAALDENASFDATFDRLFDAAAAIDQPDEARAALRRIARDRALRDTCARTVLAGERPETGLAEHAYAAAALQVHLARLAGRLDIWGASCRSARVHARPAAALRCPPRSWAGRAPTAPVTAPARSAPPCGTWCG